MFCKFGLVLDNLPVEAIVWLKDVWTFDVKELICEGIASKYVFFNLLKWR